MRLTDCAMCSKIFPATFPNEKFCSVRCQRAWLRVKNEDPAYQEYVRERRRAWDLLKEKTDPGYKKRKDKADYERRKARRQCLV